MAERRDRGGSVAAPGGRGGAPAAPVTPEKTPGGILPNPGVSLVLLLAWLALANSVHPRLILLGAVFAVAVPYFTRAFLPVRPKVRSWSTALRFVPLFLWDVIVANMVVAWLIINVRRTLRPVWLVIPLDITNPYAVTTLASVISLTPGTVSSELSADRRTLLVHALDVEDPEAEVARIKQRYEAPIKEIFE
jgi:multicomponent K+:H+ antiporter subunit E